MQDNENGRRQHSKDYWFAELRSLGLEPKRPTVLNNDTELADLVDNIKQTYFHDYKTAYDDERFDYII